MWPQPICRHGLKPIWENGEGAIATALTGEANGRTIPVWILVAGAGMTKLCASSTPQARKNILYIVIRVDSRQKRFHFL